MSLPPRCLNYLAEFIQLRLYVLIIALFPFLFFPTVCKICVMCLTPRNRFEFVDKLQRVESYTTYNAEIDICDYFDVDEKISVSDGD